MSRCRQARPVERRAQHQAGLNHVVGKSRLAAWRRARPHIAPSVNGLHSVRLPLRSAALHLWLMAICQLQPIHAVGPASASMHQCLAELEGTATTDPSLKTIDRRFKTVCGRWSLAVECRLVLKAG